MRDILRVLIAVHLALVMAVAGCTETKEPETPAETPETLRDRAQKVGKFSDRAFTNHLEKDLVGAVDSAAENAKRLEEANKLSDE